MGPNDLDPNANAGAYLFYRYLDGPLTEPQRFYECDYRNHQICHNVV